MFNKFITNPWDQWILALNVVMALFATYYNFRAALISKVPAVQARFLSIGLLAFFISIMYSVMDFTDVSPGNFSSLLRGLSIATWPIVWILPARFMYRIQFREMMAEAIADEVRKSLDV